MALTRAGNTAWKKVESPHSGYDRLIHPKASQFAEAARQSESGAHGMSDFNRAEARG